MGSDKLLYEVVPHSNIPLAPSHCHALLVFSSVQGLHVCLGRAAWAYPWTHKQPAVMKAR